MPEDDEVLTLSHATERDVDLLLVEEIACGDAFLGYVANETFGQTLAEIGYVSHRVLHSSRRMHNRREIDITVEIKRAVGEPIILLIENKLDAGEQVDQAMSYREEAAHLQATGAASTVRTVLVRPEQYGRTNAAFGAQFDHCLSYEDIATFLRLRADDLGGELGHRLSHRARLMDQAVTKGRRGYRAVPLPIIADFNSAYVALCRREFPNLKPGPAMLKAVSPGESVTMIFGPDTLPKWSHLPQMRLVHQLREANVNLSFFGWGDHFADLVAPLSVALKGTGFKIVPTINKRKAGRSGLMIVAMTPAVSNQMPFAEQEAAVVAGLQAAETLRRWLADNRPLTETLSSLIIES
ncbi:hypothetical protein BH09PSE1_BH09PSE1_15660 [soil metagenome]